MNTKNNQRTRLSKLLLKNALMDLLKEKNSISKISIKEICEKAELNRSTFYAHYNEPEDLLDEVENELLESTENHLQKIGAEDKEGAYKYILSFLQYIKANDKQFRILLVDSYDPSFKSKFMSQTIVQFVENLNIELPNDLEQYIFSYILNGCTGIITQWIRANYVTDEDTMVDLLFRICNSTLVNLAY